MRGPFRPSTKTEMSNPGGRLTTSSGGTTRVGAATSEVVVAVPSNLDVCVGSGAVVGRLSDVGGAVGTGIAVGAGVAGTSWWNSPITWHPLSASRVSVTTTGYTKYLRPIMHPNLGHPFNLRQPEIFSCCLHTSLVHVGGVGCRDFLKRSLFSRDASKDAERHLNE